MNPYTILTRLGLFAGTAALGAVLTFGVTQLTQPAGPSSVARERPDIVSMPGAGDVPGSNGSPGSPGSGANPIFAAFNLVPAASPKPVPSADPAVLNLVAALAPEAGPSPNGVPRVPPVSQFDGSTFQGANCNLAAGAMLARLGWGIVTTGGILRDLQDDKDGGTDLGDLATALWRGYGVSFSWGAITVAQLRTLIGAGYGAVIHGNYGALKPPINKQPSFTGPHAIYIDAFFPASEKNPAAYYVIDPLHKASGGYRGEWVPAAVVEQFAQSLAGSGRIVAAWAFPVGGAVPELRDIEILPTAGGVTPKPGEPPPDPADPPIKLTVEAGDVTVSLPPSSSAPPLDGPATGGEKAVPQLDFCVLLPKPNSCPGGIIGRYGNSIPILVAKLFPTIDVKFVDAVKPNDVLVGFTVSTSGPATVEFWKADGTGGVLAATSYSSTTVPGSDPIRVAHLPTLAGTQYKFQVVAGGIVGARSEVGSFTTAAGVKYLDLAISKAFTPKLALESAFSIYARPEPDALVPPVLPCSSPPPGSDVVLLGSEPHCLPPVSSPPPVASCATVVVTYELTGMTGEQVSVLAFPAEGVAHPDGSPAEEAIVEVVGPLPSGKVTVGCLTPGAQYEIALDIIGDTLGILTSQVVTAPSS